MSDDLRADFPSWPVSMLLAFGLKEGQFPSHIIDLDGLWFLGVSDGIAWVSQKSPLGRAIGAQLRREARAREHKRMPMRTECHVFALHDHTRRSMVIDGRLPSIFLHSSEEDKLDALVLRLFQLGLSEEQINLLLESPPIFIGRGHSQDGGLGQVTWRLFSVQRVAGVFPTGKNILYPNSEELKKLYADASQSYEAQLVQVLIDSDDRH